jgi:hypothetical protein
MAEQARARKKFRQVVRTGVLPRPVFPGRPLDVESQQACYDMLAPCLAVVHKDLRRERIEIHAAASSDAAFLAPDCDDNPRV